MEDTENIQKHNEKLDAQIALAKTELELKKQRIRMLQYDLEQQSIISRRLLAEAEAEELKTESLRIEVDTRKRAYREVMAANRYHYIYRFDEEINETTVDHCMERLNMWHRTDPSCEIEIIFNSNGGSVIYGMALFDYITELRNEGHKITTGTRGIAASMASILLQAGETRWMGRHATLMIHQPSGTVAGKTDDMHDQLEWLNGLQDQALDIYAKRCADSGAEEPLTREEIKAGWKRKDWFMDSTTAMKKGLVDEIRG